MNIHLKNFINKKFKKPGKALDLGAGDFIDIACIKQLGWKCEGVDIKNGINLEKTYASENKPFDLVYSNYVLHKLKNKKLFIKTIYNNLKNNGWFFVHTFDISDSNSTSKISRNFLQESFKKQGFKNIEIKLFSYYDNEDKHKHWHKILEIIGKR